MKDFLVVHLKLSPTEPYRDICIAMLDNLGYDSFEETEEGLKAYIRESEYRESEIRQLPILQSDEVDFSLSTEKLDSINWNEEWERNYSPVYVEDKLQVRAPFHDSKPGFRHEIVIEPKMSFGTGHHETTRLMSRMMFTMALQQKRVLDMGTGTGVLAILAEQLGAGQVLAIDNFEWAVTNTAENSERNNCQKVSALLGDASALSGKHFDVILANINRNVLLEDMAAYAKCLPAEGSLVMSGFLEADFELIDEQAEELGLHLEEKIQEKNWLCCKYLKS